MVPLSVNTTRPCHVADKRDLRVCVLTGKVAHAGPGGDYVGQGQGQEGNSRAHDQGDDCLVGLDGVGVGEGTTDVPSSIYTDSNNQE